MGSNGRGLSSRADREWAVFVDRAGLVVVGGACSYRWIVVGDVALVGVWLVTGRGLWLWVWLVGKEELAGKGRGLWSGLVLHRGG